jgi:GT2 family glycosyltransferase
MEAVVKASAIVSAYFCERWLPARLENLLGQDCQICLVAQDGSKELEIAKKYAREIDRIAVTPDLVSIYKAWNIAVKMSDMPYCFVANSDDIHAPGAVTEMSDLLDAHPEWALVYPDYDRVNEEGSYIGKYELKEGQFDELYKGCFVGSYPMWRRSLHERYGYFDEEFLVAGDYEFWLRITSQGEVIHHIPKVLGRYMERSNSAEYREPIRKAWCISRVRAKYRFAATGEEI